MGKLAFTHHHMVKLSKSNHLESLFHPGIEAWILQTIYVMQFLLVSSFVLLNCLLKTAATT